MSRNEVREDRNTTNETSQINEICLGHHFVACNAYIREVIQNLIKDILKPPIGEAVTYFVSFRRLSATSQISFSDPFHNNRDHSLLNRTPGAPAVTYLDLSRYIDVSSPVTVASEFHFGHRTFFTLFPFTIQKMDPITVRATPKQAIFVHSRLLLNRGVDEDRR